MNDENVWEMKSSDEENQVLFNMVNEIFDDNFIRNNLIESINETTDSLRRERLAFITADSKVYQRVRGDVVNAVYQKVRVVEDVTTLDDIAEWGVNKIIENYLTEVDTYIEKRHDIEEKLNDLKELTEDSEITAEEQDMAKVLLKAVTTGIMTLEGDPKQSAYANKAKGYATILIG